MKKIIFMFICLLLPSLSYAYVDIDTSHWAYTDITKLKNRNIVSGYPDDTFRADNYITEEELITILLNVANSEISKSLVSWPEDYIKVAQDNELKVTQNFVTRQSLLDLTQKIKSLERIKLNNTMFTNRLNKANNFLNERELVNLTSSVTRAEVCVFINKLLNMSKTKLPLELSSVNHSNSDIKTIINSAEIVEFNSYDGKHKAVINKIEEGGHPYLDYRRTFAEDNYLLIIDVETINNSEYEVPTGYDYLKLDFMQEDISIIDEFDVDEINTQVINQPYNGVFVKSKDKQNTTAFYVLDKMPQSVKISRDINTLYNAHTNEYVNVNQLNSTIINF